ncbi:hypothetical protein E3N88_37551 [Mikania micrantha]|uniref:Uncharacterized protein n=1 Tax=Mikania micrantha TaxID=192012 RepID=A0A5N6LRF4_9ASTR|nr:hypothetical protein E3N88_37551 [Mikania micrantha]
MDGPETGSHCHLRAMSQNNVHQLFHSNHPAARKLFFYYLHEKRPYERYRPLSVVLACSLKLIWCCLVPSVCSDSDEGYYIRLSFIVVAKASLSAAPGTAEVEFMIPRVFIAQLEWIILLFFTRQGKEGSLPAEGEEAVQFNRFNGRLATLRKGIYGTVRPTGRTETKVGHSDPGVPCGRALAQRIKGETVEYVVEEGSNGRTKAADVTGPIQGSTRGGGSGGGGGHADGVILHTFFVSKRWWLVVMVEWIVVETLGKEEEGG